MLLIERFGFTIEERSDALSFYSRKALPRGSNVSGGMTTYAGMSRFFSARYETYCSHRSMIISDFVRCCGSSAASSFYSRTMRCCRSMSRSWWASDSCYFMSASSRSFPASSSAH